MTTQQLVNSCQTPAQGRATSRMGVRRAASGAARLTGKHIALKQASFFTGVC